MSKRSPVPARLLAAAALVCGVAVLLIVVATSLSGGGSSHSPAPKGEVTHAKKGNKASLHGASYVVQSGDTLTSIAHETGVSVSQILKLNPGVDPQILISGEKLKLR